jgi:hypothetical protein
MVPVSREFENGRPFEEFMRFGGPLQLRTIDGRFAVTRLPAESPLPEWASGGPFSSVTRTAGELSIVCREENVPLNVTSERGFKCLCVADPLEFTLVGVLAAILEPLADAGVAVFVVSTFDTDYLMVKERDFEACIQALVRAGHRVSYGKDCEDA